MSAVAGEGRAPVGFRAAGGISGGAAEEAAPTRQQGDRDEDRPGCAEGRTRMTVLLPASARRYRLRARVTVESSAVPGTSPSLGRFFARGVLSARHRVRQHPPGQRRVGEASGRERRDDRFDERTRIADSHGPQGRGQTVPGGVLEVAVEEVPGRWDGDAPPGMGEVGVIPPTPTRTGSRAARTPRSPGWPGEAPGLVSGRRTVRVEGSTVVHGITYGWPPGHGVRPSTSAFSHTRWQSSEPTRYRLPRSRAIPVAPVTAATGPPPAANQPASPPVTVAPARTSQARGPGVGRRVQLPAGVLGVGAGSSADQAWVTGDDRLDGAAEGARGTPHGSADGRVRGRIGHVDLVGRRVHRDVSGRGRRRRRSPVRPRRAR